MADEVVANFDDASFSFEAEHIFAQELWTRLGFGDSLHGPNINKDMPDHEIWPGDWGTGL